MFTPVYWIHNFENGSRIGIMARPRGHDWLADEIMNLKKFDVSVIVSLLEWQEINQLGLEKQQLFCTNNGIDFINFPIRDREVPEANDKTEAFLNELSSRLESGASIVIHCRMGIGRSSIIAGSLLVGAGIQAHDVFHKISKVRGLKVPDTAEQVNWLLSRSS